MRNMIIFASLLNFSHLLSAHPLQDARIDGKIINGTNKTIQIGEMQIPLSESGEFQFSVPIESPGFYEITCDKAAWSVYLEPGAKAGLTMTANDLSSLAYTGDYIPENEFLKTAGKVNEALNAFFNRNWVPVHCQNESDYMMLIDSLKGCFFNALDTFQKEDKDLSKTFVKLFRADVHFGLNGLILRYPESHLRYTGEKVELSQNGQKYLDDTVVDDIDLMTLQSYSRYGKAWIDLQADRRVNQENDSMHYDLKKMGTLFETLSAMFQTRELLDFWMAEYLAAHIENNGLANSEPFISAFLTKCETEKYSTQIEKLVDGIREGEKDHRVRTYKTIEGFVLQAHLFYPDSMKNEEKRPAIVIFHGGGFVLGNPAWAFEKARHYAGLGMIAVAAQYRLSNRHDITPVDALHDANDLMIWLRTHADSLNILENKIAASGWSVGGQLAASTAIFPDTLAGGAGVMIHSTPNALLLTSPAVSVSPNDWFNELMNGIRIESSRYSPVDNVREGLPPAIILQGRDDTVTPLKGAQHFHDQMTAKNNDCELIIYDGVGHLFTPSTLNDNGWPRPDPDVQREANAKADAFLIKFGFIEK